MFFMSIKRREVLLVAIFASFSLVIGCVSRQQRVLSQEESAKLGLTGIIHDARLCPTEFKNGQQVISGDCEYVTCLPKGQGVKCVARKKVAD